MAPYQNELTLRSGSLLSKVLGWNPSFRLFFLPLFPFPLLFPELLLIVCDFCCLIGCVSACCWRLPTAPTWFSPNLELTRRTSVEVKKNLTNFFGSRPHYSPGYISRNCWMVRVLPDRLPCFLDFWARERGAFVMTLEDWVAGRCVLGGCVRGGCVLGGCVLGGCVLGGCVLGGWVLGGCVLGGWVLGGGRVAGGCVFNDVRPACAIEFIKL